LSYYFNIAIAQKIPSQHKLYKKAINYFNNEEYKQALKLFLIIDSLSTADFELKYNIGACYLNSANEKVKAIPYLEYAISKDKKNIPEVVFKDLGTLYHLDYKFAKSIEAFNLFLGSSYLSNNDVSYAVRMIEICKNALIIVSDTINVKIANIGKPINTELSEINPLIPADESILYYQSVDELNINNNNIYSTTRIADGSFQKPNKVDISTENSNNFLAGIAPDGAQLFLSFNNKISSCNIENNKCTKLEILTDKVNSEFSEYQISISVDGNEYYFSSNRPGGFGGKDLYKVVKDENGKWGDAINLGSAINTAYDEESPFIHPDDRTLYFSSNGHNTIGGFDIFKSIKYNNEWSSPENLGFPINSTNDDINFIMSADGQVGYFSSCRKDGLGGFDIYKVYFSKSIPLTLVKGTILAGNPLKPTNAKIIVIDKETNKRVKYIYNPSSKTGKYLMIFPPNKNYDMVIEAEGYLPRIINIYVPNQTYFYELFQEINLKPVNALNKSIGEELTVINTFYDIFKNKVSKEDLIATDTTNKDYNKLLKLIENIINTTDSIGLEKIDKITDTTNVFKSDEESKKTITNLLNLIEEAINTTDTSILQLVNKNTLFNEKATQTYFYSLDKVKSNLKAYLIDNDTIYSINPLIVSSETNSINENKKKEKEYQIDIKKTTIKERNNIISYQIYFDKNQYVIKNEYKFDIEEISNLLLNNQNLCVEIFGYASSEGVDLQNITLSEQRAREVLKIFVNNKINPKRAIMKGYGASISKDEQDEKERAFNRKVELKVFEIIENEIKQ